MDKLLNKQVFLPRPGVIRVTFPAIYTLGVESASAKGSYYILFS